MYMLISDVTFRWGDMGRFDINHNNKTGTIDINMHGTITSRIYDVTLTPSICLDRYNMTIQLPKDQMKIQRIYIQ